MERRNFVCPHTLSYASTIGLCWRHNAELNGAGAYFSLYLLLLKNASHS